MIDAKISTNSLIELSKTEGDLNSTPYRNEWLTNNVGAESREWLEEDANYFIHQSLSTPCLDVLESCEGIYLTNIEGKKYIDFHGNNLHQLGYRNPYIIDKIIQQLQVLPFSPRRYTNISAIKAAEKLASACPGNLNKILFTPGGASSVGLALKIARTVTGNYKTISMWDSFHGASLETISLGGESIFRKGIGPLNSGNEHVPYPDSYRGIFWSDTYGDEKYAEYIEFILEREGDVAAIIAEPIRNTSVHIPSASFWKRIRKACDKHGALLIFDEIPTFMGRTGKMFVFENYEVIPDIVVVGKALGGGIIPFSAVIVNDELDIPADKSLGHYTFEKNPLGAAALIASLEFIENENLLEKVSLLSGVVKTRLWEMYSIYPIIGDIRGIGLLWGIELVTDRELKTPAIKEAEKIMYHCLEHGLSFKVSQGNVLTLCPPLIIEKAELLLALTILENAIRYISEEQNSI